MELTEKIITGIATTVTAVGGSLGLNKYINREQDRKLKEHERKINDLQEGQNELNTKIELNTQADLEYREKVNDKRA